MTERALDAHRRRTVAGELHRDPDDGVGLQERQRIGRVVQIELTSLEELRHRGRYRVNVYFQAGAEDRRRTDARADSAKTDARYCLVQLQRVAPECFVPERVEPEDPPALVEQLCCTLEDRIV